MLTDPDTGLLVLTKQPWEDLVFDMEFKRRLRAGVTLASIDSVVVTNQGKVAGSSDVTDSGPAVSGTRAQVTFTGGTDGENYKITVRAITSAGKKVEGDGMLYVRD